MAGNQGHIIEAVIIRRNHGFARGMEAEVLPGMEVLAERAGNRLLPQLGDRCLDLFELIALVVVAHWLKMQLANCGRAPARAT